MSGWERRHDGTFIANARTDLPAVVAALRDALAEVAQLTTEREQLRGLPYPVHLGPPPVSIALTEAEENYTEALARAVMAENEVAASGESISRLVHVRADLIAERDALAAEVADQKSKQRELLAQLEGATAASAELAPLSIAAERDALAERIRKVEALHSEDEYGNCCECLDEVPADEPHDDFAGTVAYPCPTARAIAVTEDSEGES